MAIQSTDLREQLPGGRQAVVIEPHETPAWEEAELTAGQRVNLLVCRAVLLVPRYFSGRCTI